MTDPLLRATAALREKYDVAPPEGDPATRARVLDSATLRRRESRIGRALLVPIAATFVLFATWAAATGRLSGVSRWVESNETVAPAPSASPLPAHTSVPAPGTSRPKDELELPSVETPAPEPFEARGVLPPQSASARVEVSPRPSAVESVAAAASSSQATRASQGSAVRTPTSDEDTHYATAHAAHFEARDWPRALEGWNAYLAAHPSGRFAPEARYNRALCLLRLGQIAKGREALAPFADGREGGYRKTEASKLLETFADAGP